MNIDIFYRTFGISYQKSEVRGFFFIKMTKNESVYNLVPDAPSPVIKGQRYKSVHDPLLPPTGSTFITKGLRMSGPANMGGGYINPIEKQQHGTFGLPLGEAKANPQKILKKHEKAKRVDDLKQALAKNPDVAMINKRKEKIRPPIPLHDDNPIMNLVSDTNYVVSNAVTNILTNPPRMEEEKRYVSKDDYGKVPEYLTKLKHQMQQIKTNEETMAEQRRKAGQHYGHISEEEKDKSLVMLRTCLKTKMELYQSFSHKTSIDTFVQLKKKDRLEAEIEEIEKLIENFERKQVFVEI